MNSKGAKYVSIFKIDGIPILPPLMTTEKRREMANYREKAIAFAKAREKQRENKKIERRQETPWPAAAFSEAESEIQTEDEYMKVSSILHKELRSVKQNAQIIATEDDVPRGIVNVTAKCLDHLKKSDTFIYDVISNTVIIPSAGECEKESKDSKKSPLKVYHSPESTSVSSDQPTSDLNDSHEITDTTSIDTMSLDISSTAATVTEPTNSSPFISIPSICINPPTPLVPDKPFVEEPKSKPSPDKSVSSRTTQRSATSPSLKGTTDSDVTLIRSNSFTLDSPSSALLQHIRNQRMQKERRSASLSRATKDTIESKAKKVQKVETKPRAPTSEQVYGNNLFRSKRSPYEIRPSSKSKLSRKHKSPSAKIVSAVAVARARTPPNKAMESPEHDSEKFRDLEVQHRQKLLDLIRHQQEEQKRLQESFEKQQKVLLEQLTADINKNVHVSISPTQDTSITSDSIQQALNETAENLENQRNSTTPRRRLFSQDPLPSQLLETQNEQAVLLKRRLQYHTAATTINAFARGYLTRRLFKTDFVQRIIQTIRDTLLFALDLHVETKYDESAENIKLKARLLQQLTTACNSLHEVFFKFSTKERMDIIARDRKNIKRKMENMKSFRSPRIDAFLSGRIG